MEIQKREKLYKQMMENPDNLSDLYINTLFIDLNNSVSNGKMKILDITEFLNLFNTLFLFYVIFNYF